MRLIEKEVPPTKHRLLFFGAGSAGVGVAKQLLEFFKIEHGMSEDDAKKLVWFVDTKVGVAHVHKQIMQHRLNSFQFISS